MFGISLFFYQYVVRGLLIVCFSFEHYSQSLKLTVFPTAVVPPVHTEQILHDSNEVMESSLCVKYLI